MSIEFEGTVDFGNNAPLKFNLETVSSLPSAGGNNAKRIVFYNGFMYYSNGTNWIKLEASIGGGSTIQLPQNTVFVSPTFNNTSPFYSSPANAILGSTNGSYIVVYSGYYPGDIDMSKRHWYFHSNTSISGESIVAYDANTSIRGHCDFSGGTSSNALTVSMSGSANVVHELEFNSTIEGNFVLNQFAGIVKAGLIGETLQIIGGTYDSYNLDLYIKAEAIWNLSINSPDHRIYIDVQTINGVSYIGCGDTTIEFKKIIYPYTGDDVFTVAGDGADNKLAKLKLIDGRFPEAWDSSTNYPLNIGKYAIVQLQHVWIYNVHCPAVFISSTLSNTHKLKVDNCILIGNSAIDATLTGQQVHCFGSWGQNDVTSNISMQTEPLSVGSIW